MASQKDLPHDLLQYVVEAACGYEDGFWALLARGADGCKIHRAQGDQARTCPDRRPPVRTDPGRGAGRTSQSGLDFRRALARHGRAGPGPSHVGSRQPWPSPGLRVALAHGCGTAYGLTFGADRPGCPTRELDRPDADYKLAILEEYEPGGAR